MIKIIVSISHIIKIIENEEQRAEERVLKINNSTAERQSQVNDANDVERS